MIGLETNFREKWRQLTQEQFGVCIKAKARSASTGVREQKGDEWREKRWKEEVRRDSRVKGGRASEREKDVKARNRYRPGARRFFLRTGSLNR